MINFFVVDDGEILHRWLGYTASILVCARVIWGFIGPRYARFADFSRPRRDYVRIWPRCVPAPGIITTGTTRPAPWSCWPATCSRWGLPVFCKRPTLSGANPLQELHEALAATLIGAAGLHVTAAIVMSHLERTNLIKDVHRRQGTPGISSRDAA